MVLAVSGTFFKALPCFCLIMHSLKNNINLECVKVPENLNHAILYISNYFMSNFKVKYRHFCKQALSSKMQHTSVEKCKRFVTSVHRFAFNYTKMSIQIM